MTSLWVVSHGLLWAAVIVQGIVILALMRQVGTLLLRVGSSPLFEGGVGPAVGEPAPWDPASIGWDRPDKLQLLAFMSVGCGTCERLVPALNAVARAYDDRLRVAALAREDSRAVLDWSKGLGFEIPVASVPAAFDAFGITGTPYAFVLDQDLAVLAKGGVNHVEDLETLLGKCRPSHSHEAEPVELQNVLVSHGDERSDGDGA